MDFPISDMYPALATSAVALAIMVLVWTRIPTNPRFNPARVAITVALVAVTAIVAWITCYDKHQHRTMAKRLMPEAVSAPSRNR